jgi:hypothetical protein
VSATVAAVKNAYTEADFFETVCQIRGDQLYAAGTYELVHHIRGKATPDELALGSFAPRKLAQLPTWDLWFAEEWKQLGAHQMQEVFGVPCPAPPGATVCRSHWNFFIVGLVKLACIVMDLCAPLQCYASPKRMPRASTNDAYVSSLPMAVSS